MRYLRSQILDHVNLVIEVIVDIDTMTTVVVIIVDIVVIIVDIERMTTVVATNAKDKVSNWNKTLSISDGHVM